MSDEMGDREGTTFLCGLQKPKQATRRTASSYSSRVVPLDRSVARPMQLGKIDDLDR
jgi:hypothetical protein